MRTKILLLVSVQLLLFSTFLHAQVATNTGSIYGKVLDEKGGPLPGVNNQLDYAYGGRFGIRPFSEWYIKVSSYAY
jgi:hypothetical protein